MKISSYSPKQINLYDFAPNQLPDTTIFGIFTAASIVVISISWIFSGMFWKTTKVERLLICWFTFNGVLDLTIKLYLPFNPDFYKDTSGSYFAEIWKEFSKGDSRYASFESTVTAMQGISILIVGPFCFLTAYAIATHKSYKYVLQLAISLWHYYGLAIYYITAILDGNHYSVNANYYYSYFIGSKWPWALIPFPIIIRSWRNVCKSEVIYERKIQ